MGRGLDGLDPVLLFPTLWPCHIGLYKSTSGLPQTGGRARTLNVPREALDLRISGTFFGTIPQARKV